MSKTIDFYFDFASPASFLGYTQIEAIAERTGAALVWKPMLLGGVFKATGNASPNGTPTPPLEASRATRVVPGARRAGAEVIFAVSTTSLNRSTTTVTGVLTRACAS